MVEHRRERSGSDDPGQGDRVAKALARAGVASRREVERYIAEGRVALNGRVLESPAVKVGPGDVLTVDGKVIDDAEPTRLWRYHKPVGLLTSHKDPQGRPTVFEALPPGLPRVISVGRLDINSEGLLLLTNDGSLARALELPSSGWVRRYRARARGRITQDRLDRLKDGVTVEGVNYGPIEARLDKAKEGPQGANLWITIGITEGKNREVRRVLDHLGLKVNRLIRLAYGPFQLGPLGAGEVEEVGPRVIRELLAGHIAPENMPKGDKVAPTPRPAAQTRRPGAPPPRGQDETGPHARARPGSKAPPRGAPVERDERKGYGARGAGPKPEGRPGKAAPRRPAAADAAPAAEKKTYKAGWAKPKIKPRAPPKAGKPRGPAKPRGER